MDLVLEPVEDPFEFHPGSDRPVHGERPELEHIFKFVDQLQRVARGAIALVHEGKDRHAALVADLKKFSSLAFDALGCIDDHDDGVHGGQDPVGVLRKILVAGGIEQVDLVAVILELKGRRTDGDTPLPFQLHPVGGGRPLVFAGGDRAGELDGAAVQQELLGHRRLPGVRV